MQFKIAFSFCIICVIVIQVFCHHHHYHDESSQRNNSRSFGKLTFGPAEKRNTNATLSGSRGLFLLLTKGNHTISKSTHLKNYLRSIGVNGTGDGVTGRPKVIVGKGNNGSIFDLEKNSKNGFNIRNQEDAAHSTTKIKINYNQGHTSAKNNHGFNQKDSLVSTTNTNNIFNEEHPVHSATNTKYNRTQEYPVHFATNTKYNRTQTNAANTKYNRTQGYYTTNTMGNNDYKQTSRNNKQPIKIDSVSTSDFGHSISATKKGNSYLDPAKIDYSPSAPPMENDSNEIQNKNGGKSKNIQSSSKTSDEDFVWVENPKKTNPIIGWNADFEKPVNVPPSLPIYPNPSLNSNQIGHDDHQQFHQSSSTENYNTLQFYPAHRPQYLNNETNPNYSPRHDPKYTSPHLQNSNNSSQDFPKHHGHFDLNSFDPNNSNGHHDSQKNSLTNNYHTLQNSHLNPSNDPFVNHQTYFNSKNKSHQQFLITNTNNPHQNLSKNLSSNHIDATKYDHDLDFDEAKNQHSRNNVDQNKHSHHDFYEITTKKPFYSRNRKPNQNRYNSSTSILTTEKPSIPNPNFNPAETEYSYIYFHPSLSKYHTDWLSTPPTNKFLYKPYQYSPSLFYGPVTYINNQPRPSYSYRHKTAKKSFFGFLIGVKAAELFMHSNDDRYKNATYEIKRYRRKDHVLDHRNLNADQLKQCGENVELLCTENSFAICTKNGTIMCVTSLEKTRPCDDPKNACFTSAVNCTKFGENFDWGKYSMACSLWNFTEELTTVDFYHQYIKNPVDRDIFDKNVDVKKTNNSKDDGNIDIQNNYTHEGTRLSNIELIPILNNDNTNADIPQTEIPHYIDIPENIISAPNIFNNIDDPTKGFHSNESSFPTNLQPTNVIPNSNNNKITNSISTHQHSSNRNPRIVYYNFTKLHVPCVSNLTIFGNTTVLKKINLTESGDLNSNRVHYLRFCVNVWAVPMPLDFDGIEEEKSSNDAGNPVVQQIAWGMLGKLVNHIWTG